MRLYSRRLLAALFSSSLILGGRLFGSDGSSDKLRRFYDHLLDAYSVRRSSSIRRALRGSDGLFRIYPGSHIILVPGSFSGEGKENEWYTENGDFRQALENSLRVNATVEAYPWAGDTGFLLTQMINAAATLATVIATHVIDSVGYPGEPHIVLISHSNGGNVSKLATQLLRVWRSPESLANKFLRELDSSGFFSLKTVESEKKIRTAFVGAAAAHRTTVLGLLKRRGISMERYVEALSKCIDALVMMGTPHVKYIKCFQAFVKRRCNFYSEGDDVQDVVGFTTFRINEEGGVDNNPLDGDSDHRIVFVKNVNEEDDPGHRELHDPVVAEAIAWGVPSQTGTLYVAHPADRTLPEKYFHVDRAIYSRTRRWCFIPTGKIPDERFFVDMSCEVL